MTDILLSGGWLFAEHGHDVSNHVEYISMVDGVELFPIKQERIEKTMEYPTSIGNVTTHLPQETEYIDKIALIHDKYNPSVSVFHPVVNSGQQIENYLNHGIDVSIENMDKRKEDGVVVNRLENLREKFETGFVLDVQHAFEHDPSMDYAKQLLETFSDHLVEFHVSGEQRDLNHSLVHKADNKEPIKQFLEFATEEYKIPRIVIEGKYQTQNDVRREKDLLDEIITN